MYICIHAIHDTCMNFLSSIYTKVLIPNYSKVNK